MAFVIALLYVAAVILLFVAWVFAVAGKPGRYALVVLAGMCALLAFALPAMQAGFAGK
jgi:hypothetical protein